MREKRSVMAPHNLCQMVVVIGCWEGSDAIVLGACEDSYADALDEEGKWAAWKAALWERSGWTETVPKESLREVKVPVWMPFLWEALPVAPDSPEALLVDPDDRYRAAVAALRRREGEAMESGEQGTPNDIAIAHGEANAFEAARELLEGELPEEDVPGPLRRFVQELADEGCRNLGSQPHPCSELPGLERRLWCRGCLASAMLSADG